MQDDRLTRALELLRATIDWEEGKGICDTIRSFVDGLEDEQPLQPGDVVQLKSGGPLMTVARPWAADPQDAPRDTRLPSSCICVWMLSEREVIERCFAETILRRVEPPAQPASTTTSEPDEWQACGTLNGRPNASEPESGFKATGPWFPFAVSASSGFVWRRPLRKVEP